MKSCRVQFFALALLLVLPFAAAAQAPAPTTAAPQAQLLKPGQLDQLVAPIALYPDPLLAEVLMASAYPLEVVQADRWLQANKNLKGDTLKAAVDQQPWDESVKSLVATPDVLAMMSDKLDWTQQLGDAVVAQHPDVMDAVQRLRAKAQSNNKLASTKQQTVTVNQVQGKRVIAIEPTQPDTVFVPYYDPAVVYGEWPYADYPPYYFPPPPYLGTGLIAAGILFGAGYALAYWGGRYWNGGINWSGGGNNIIVNPPGHRPGGPISGAGNKWQPRVEHRQGAGDRGGRQQKLDFRGSGGQQVLKPGAKPGGDRAKVGEGKRPGKGPSVSHRAQTGRPSAKARPSRGGAAQHRAAPVHRGPARAASPHARGGRASVGGRGGRRSDIRLKHDIVLLGHLDNGLGFYRFSYTGSAKAYVGVMAQDVQRLMPEAVERGRDGYLRVYYDKLGLKFESYRHWIGAGAHIPETVSKRSSLAE